MGGALLSRALHYQAWCTMFTAFSAPRRCPVLSVSHGGLACQMVEAHAVIPHDLALGFDPNAGQLQESLDAMRKGTVSVRVIDGHDDVVVANVVNDDAEQGLVHVRTNKTLPPKILTGQGRERVRFAATIFLPLV